MPLRGEAGQRAERVEPEGGALGQKADRGFTAAFELVATPALFGFFGYLIDGRLGTGRAFTIGFAAVVLVYLVWKLVYQYSAEMAKHEAELIASRQQQPSGLRTGRP